MEDSHASLRELATDASLTLLAGWKSGPGKYKIARIRTSTGVADELRGVATSYKDSIGGREVESWTPDADLSPETVLHLPLENLGPQPRLVRPHQDHDFVDVIRGRVEVAELKPTSIPAASIAFYVITIGDDPTSRTAFLRRMNPQRGLGGGRIFSILREVLVEVKDPIFGFDSYVDLVFHQDSVWIMSQASFAALFRENETLAKQIPGWVDDIREYISISDTAADSITGAAVRDTRIRTRLEAIARRGHLENVTPDQMREEMMKHDLEPSDFIEPTGELKCDDSNLHLLLQFLNEDLFVGALSSSSFRAAKKHTR